MTQKKWKAYFVAIKFQAWPEALKVLTEISQIEKDNPRVLMSIGEIYERLGDRDKAVAFYRHSAFVLKSQKAYHKALLLHKIVLRILPGDESSLKESRDLLAMLEESRRAEAVADEVLQEEVQPEVPKFDIWPADDQTPSPGTGQPEAPPAAEPPAEPKEPEVKRVLTEEEQLKEFMGNYSKEMSEREFEEFARPVDEKRSSAEDSELFAGIPPQVLAATLKEAESHSYSDGEAVIREGDLGDSLYVIRAGSARVVSDLFDKEVELAVLTEGEAFGEAGFLTGKPRTASVVAKGSMQVYELKRGLLEQLINLNPSVLSRMEEFYELRVLDTMKKIEP